MKLSVFVVTYNHEHFIKECLDGILMQQTTFDFEVVIGDDSSQDSTRKICEQYAEKYENIKLLTQAAHLGVSGNWKRVLLECTGEFVAMCEGDDYWTDPHKLQKQVDFLELHREFTGCFHNAMRVNENGDFLYLIHEENMKTEYIFSECIQGWFVPTASFVFRRKKEIIDGIEKNAQFSHVSTDRLLVALVSFYGKLGYLNEAMSSYRKHKQAVSQSYILSNIMKGNVILFKTLRHYFYPIYKNELKHQIFRWHGQLAMAYIHEKKYLKYLKSVVQTLFYARTFNELKAYVKLYVLKASYEIN